MRRGGSDKPVWDICITITNATILRNDLAAHAGNVSADAEILTRIDADMFTPGGMQQPLAYATTYLIFLDHDERASSYVRNTITNANYRIWPRVLQTVSMT